MSRTAHEEGAGTVLLLGVAAVVVLLMLAVGALGTAQRARGAAQAAADLGALAAATALQAGLDPCVTASEAVERNGAELTDCRPEEGGAVQVAATRSAAGRDSPGRAHGWGIGPASAAARAGPRPAGMPSPAAP